MTIHGMSSAAHKNEKVLFSPPVILWKHRLPALLQIMSRMSTFRGFKMETLF